MTSAKAIEVAKRHAEWLKRRIEGWSYRRIAGEYSVAVSTVEEAVSKELKSIRTEPAAELRSLEVERLDVLLQTVWERATGDIQDRLDGLMDAACIEAIVSSQLQALEAARKVMADRRKLLGLDAPTKVQDVTPPREELWVRVRGWLAAPTPELEAVMIECGWRRVG